MVVAMAKKVWFIDVRCSFGFNPLAQEESNNNMSNWSTRGCWELLRSSVEVSRPGRLDDAGGMKVRCTRRRAGRRDAWPLFFPQIAGKL